MIETGLYPYLLSKPGLTALVGAGSAARVYPLAAPRDAAYPRVTFRRTGTARGYQADGRQDGLAQATVELSAWGGVGAGAYLAARQVAEQLRLSLSGFEHSTWGTTFSVQFVKVEDEYDDFEPPQFASEADSRGVVMIVSVTFEEPVPTPEQG